MSAGERSGWRDADLSRRHRRWGFFCPGVDLDFVLVEYHLSLPVAIVEYKHHKARVVDPTHPTYQALAALADREPAVPFLVARYWPDRWAFHITSLNDQARAHFGDEASMSEAEFVAALHDLRRLTVQDAVVRHLNTDRPPIHQPALTRALEATH